MLNVFCSNTIDKVKFKSAKNFVFHYYFINSCFQNFVHKRQTPTKNNHFIFLCQVFLLIKTFERLHLTNTGP